jgi:hypothetical protein
VMGAGGVILPPATYFDKVFFSSLMLQTWFPHFQDGCKDSLPWENVIYFHFSNSYKIITSFSPYFLFSRISIRNGENKIIKKGKLFSYFSNNKVGRIYGMGWNWCHFELLKISL